jgi:hypothetical protein
MKAGEQIWDLLGSPQTDGAQSVAPSDGVNGRVRHRAGHPAARHAAGWIMRPLPHDRADSRGQAERPGE